MKKFTLSLASAIVAHSGLAQTSGSHGETIDAHGIIIAPPADAELRSYDREGYFVIYGEDDGYAALYPYEINDRVQIAVCADDTYFIKDPVSQVKTGAWVMGVRMGDELHVPAGQKLQYDESDGTYLQTFRSCFDAVGNIDDNYEDFIFEIRSLSNGGEVLSFMSYESNYYIYNFMGAVWTDTYSSIEAIGDYAVTLTYDPDASSEENTPIVLPANIQMKPYIMHAYSYAYTAENNYRDTYIDANIQIGFDDDDMYIVGFYYFTPEYIIKGHRNGNTIYFPQHQYLGQDGRDVPIYAIAVKYGVDEDGVEVFVDGENWTLTYDPTLDCYFGDEDGGVRFARDRHYRYGNQYDTLDEIMIYPSGESHVDAISSLSKDNDTVFSLDGRRLNKAKGLVIKNGKVTLCK